MPGPSPSLDGSPHRDTSCHDCSFACIIPSSVQNPVGKCPYFPRESRGSRARDASTHTTPVARSPRVGITHGPDCVAWHRPRLPQLLLGRRVHVCDLTPRDLRATCLIRCRCLRRAYQNNKMSFHTRGCAVSMCIPFCRHGARRCSLPPYLYSSAHFKTHACSLSLVTHPEAR